MIRVGDREFRHKTKAYDHFRAMLGRYCDGNCLFGIDATEMADLLRNRHPDGQELLGHGFRGFVVRYESAIQYGTGPHVAIVYEDGSERFVGWSKCCRGFPMQTQWAKTALRAAVWLQIKMFRETALDISPFCVATGEPLTIDTAEVDHYPITFAMLVAGFIEIERLDLEQVEIAHVHNGAPRLVDRALNNRWLSYHAAHARLRIVTKEVNRRSWREMMHGRVTS